jgi:hypothetical protein
LSLVLAAIISFSALLNNRFSALLNNSFDHFIEHRLILCQSVFAVVHLCFVGI